MDYNSHERVKIPTSEDFGAILNGTAKIPCNVPVAVAARVKIQCHPGNDIHQKLAFP